MRVATLAANRVLMRRPPARCRDEVARKGTHAAKGVEEAHARMEGLGGDKDAERPLERKMRELIVLLDDLCDAEKV